MNRLSFPTRRHEGFRMLAVVAALTTLGASASAQQTPLPPALQALQKHGARIVATFDSASGMKAYAAIVGGQPLPLYLTPDGRHVIAGMALDDSGANADDAVLERATGQALGAETWKQLESSHWIADGRADAPRVVYVFTDPNCPYCARFWADARPWVDSGKVQLRHVIIGILAPSSLAKAAALLSDKDPSAVFLAYESAHAQAVGKVIAGQRGNARPEDILKTTPTPSPTVSHWIDANNELMARLGLHGTPGIVWHDANGAVQRRSGAPEALLPEILGAR